MYGTFSYNIFWKKYNVWFLVTSVFLSYLVTNLKQELYLASKKAIYKRTSGFIGQANQKTAERSFSMQYKWGSGCWTLVCLSCIHP